MTLRTDPAALGRLAGEIDMSMDGLTRAQPAPGADAGPATPAVMETVAQLMRAAAGLIETSATTVADLQANKTTYAGVEGHNTGLLGEIPH